MGHFHLMNGIAGCMPDNDEAYAMWAHAFDSAKQLFSDSLCDECYRAMLESLASSSMFAFNDDCENQAPDDVPCRAGADYVEITPCWDQACDAPNANVSTIAICGDCVAYLANGAPTRYCFDCRLAYGGGVVTVDSPIACPQCGNDEYTSDYASRLADADVTLGATDCAYCADGEETLPPCEPWFSWRPCELCDSPDGGDREHATLWVDR